MAFPNISEVKQAAAQRVSQVSNARRLISIHTAVPALLSLVLTALSFFLSLQIDDTGGLGGLGARSMLEALQNMLQILSVVFSVFWGAGLVSTVLCWSRGDRVEDRDLLAGFRHWGPVLRSALLKILIYLGAIILANQLSSIIFSMTPLSAGMLELAEKMNANPGFMPSDTELLDAALSYLPFLALALAVVVIPVYYRLRMMDFALMEAPEKGAFFALRMSVFMTRRNCLKLFRLDLSFWWFYLLELCTAVVYYADLVLSLAGVQTGISSEVLLFVSCTVGLLLQCALYIWRQNQVSTTYAMVYRQLKPVLPQPQDPQSV